MPEPSDRCPSAREPQLRAGSGVATPGRTGHGEGDPSGASREDHAVGPRHAPVRVTLGQLVETVSQLTGDLVEQAAVVNRMLASAARRPSPTTRA
jgi:hypothetical protein